MLTALRNGNKVVADGSLSRVEFGGKRAVLPCLWRVGEVLRPISAIGH